MLSSWSPPLLRDRLSRLRVQLRVAGPRWGQLVPPPSQRSGSSCRRHAPRVVSSPPAPRLRTATGSLVYLCPLVSPECEFCGSALPLGSSDECISDECEACGRDCRYSELRWEAEAAQDEYATLAGTTLRNSGVGPTTDWEPPWLAGAWRQPDAPSDPAGEQSPWWTEEGGWRDRHAAATTMVAMAATEAAAAAAAAAPPAAPPAPAPPAPAPAGPTIKWGKAGAGEWQPICTECAPLPCASTSHFKNDDERAWWVGVLGRLN